MALLRRRVRLAPSPLNRKKKSAEPPSRVTPAAPVATPVQASTAPSTDQSAAIPSGDDVWSRVCAAAQSKTTTRVLVQTLRPVSIENNRAVLTTDDPRLLAHAKSKAELLASLFREAVGAPVQVEFQEDDGASPPPTSLANDPILEHELVRKAISLFDAKVIGIEKEND